MKLSRNTLERMIGRGSTVVGSSAGGGTSSYAVKAENAVHADTAGDVDDDSPAYARWLRKDASDAASEVITFVKGLAVGASQLFGVAANGVTTVYQLIVNSLWGISKDGDATLHDIDASGDMTVAGDTSVAGSIAVGSDAAVEGAVRAGQLITDALATSGFREASALAGIGFGVTVGANGRATTQTDHLKVLGRMIVDTLNIREATYVGGTMMLSPAGATVAKVLPLYSSRGMDTSAWSTEEDGQLVGYRLLWPTDDGTTHTTNYWHVGDQAFCQTFNLADAGDSVNVSNRRYWRLVTGVGQMTIDGKRHHYVDVAGTETAYVYDGDGNALTRTTGGTLFDGCEADGSVPEEGDKIVCLGSQADTSRQGAVVLSSEGVASIGLYDGIDGFADLNSREVHYLSKDDVRMRSDKFKWRAGSSLQTHADLVAELKMSDAQIRLGLGSTGIDIESGTVGISADKFSVYNTRGERQLGVDADGNVLVAGTIRASNFYHASCFFKEGGSYASETGERYAYCTYIDSTADMDTYGLEVGKMYTLTQFAEMTGGLYDYFPSSNFKECTGIADVVHMIPSVQNWTGNSTVLLPKPSDFLGKMVEVYPFAYGTSIRNVYVGCVDVNAMTSGIIYADGSDIVLSTTVSEDTVTISSGSRAVFLAIETTSGCYWKKL